MMLDMKRTFDEVVLTHTDPAKAAEIFANPFYQAMSSTFSGTQEYMAMEKLGQLRATRASGTSSWSTLPRPDRRWTSWTPRPDCPAFSTGGCCDCC